MPEPCTSEMSAGAVIAALAAHTPGRSYCSKALSERLAEMLGDGVGEEIRDEILLALLIVASACDGAGGSSVRRLRGRMGWSLIVERVKVHPDPHAVAGATFAQAVMSALPEEALRSALVSMVNRAERTVVMPDIADEITPDEAASLLEEEVEMISRPGIRLSLDALLWRPGSDAPSRITIECGREADVPMASRSVM